ncbi:helix-turn-helix domain-containing protein [Echinicola sp. 20G]|uniref:AraC family transcriptional regulator n=1 Tax=Echinicola sp. 20G TaxID=2781961 RepID=UPI0019100B85|nr:helix-turn-helix domain-containing protein [Echinicola sp. 20G]
MGIMIAVVMLQALTSGLLIYLNKRYKGEDLYLSLLFGVIFCHLFYKGILYWAFEDKELFDKLHGCFSLLYGPLLFFYVKSIQNKTLTSSQIILHSSPFFIGFGLNIMMVILVLVLKTPDLIINIYDLTIIISVFVSFTAYSISAFIELQGKSTDPIFQQKALISKIIASSNLLLSGMVIFGWTMLIWDISFPITSRYIYYFLMLLLFFSVIHIRTRMLFFQKTSDNNSLKIDISPQPKYRNSKIEGNELEQVIDSINQLFKEKKPFLDPDFNLDQLAGEIETSKLKITQALNMHLGKNFYQFVNTARIEESKVLLQQPHEDNLTVIGYESGFKSKSTFYKYFKEATGCSPSDYKKSIQLQH